jgi:hypothetical protein
MLRGDAGRPGCDHLSSGRTYPGGSDAAGATPGVDRERGLRRPRFRFVGRSAVSQPADMSTETAGLQRPGVQSLWPTGARRDTSVKGMGCGRDQCDRGDAGEGVGPSGASGADCPRAVKPAAPAPAIQRKDFVKIVDCGPAFLAAALVKSRGQAPNAAMGEQRQFAHGLQRE